MTLDYLLFPFFLKDIPLQQASFCFQCIRQSRNMNSHSIVIDACFKVPHSLLLYNCLNRFQKKKKNSWPKISCFQKYGKEKQSKSDFTLSTNSFQSIKQKTKPFFLKMHKDLNKNASFFTLLSYLCSSRGYLFTIQLQFFLLAQRVPWPGWPLAFQVFFSIFRGCTNASFYVFLSH